MKTATAVAIWATLCLAFLALGYATARPRALPPAAPALARVDAPPKSLTNRPMPTPAQRTAGRAPVQNVRARAAAPEFDPQGLAELGRAYVPPSRGPEAAKVTILEVSDFECPFSAKTASTLDRLIKEHPGELRHVYLHNPLGFHAEARPAALASLAAARQGRFWEFRDRLFQNQNYLRDDLYERFAEDLGLDMGRFKRDRADPGLAAQLDAEQRALLWLGAQGTPAFFVNGQPLRGALPYPRFAEAVALALRQADEALARGVAPAELHAHLARYRHPAGARFVAFLEAARLAAEPSGARAAAAGAEP